MSIVKRKYRKLEKWEQKNPRVQIILYRDDKKIGHTKLPNNEDPIPKSEIFAGVVGIIVMLGIFGIVIPSFVLINALLDGINGDLDGESIGILIGTIFFTFIIWRIFYVSFYRSFELEALYVNNGELIWVGIPYFGTKSKKFGLSDVIGIKQSVDEKGLLINLRDEKWYLVFNHNYTGRVDLDKVNESIKRAR